MWWAGRGVQILAVVVAIVGIVIGERIEWGSEGPFNWLLGFLVIGFIVVGHKLAEDSRSDENDESEP